MNKNGPINNSGSGKRLVNQKKIKPSAYNQLKQLPNKAILPILDLQDELYRRNNVAIATLVVLSALIKGKSIQQKTILNRLKPEYLGPKLIYSYLYTLIVEDIKNLGEVDISSILDKIPEFGPKIFGEPSSKLKGDYFNFALILNIDPTVDQVAKAIDMVEISAKKNGWAG